MRYRAIPSTLFIRPRSSLCFHLPIPADNFKNGNKEDDAAEEKYGAKEKSGAKKADTGRSPGYLKACE